MSVRGRTQIVSHTVGLMQCLVVRCGRTRFALPAGIVRSLGRVQEASAAMEQPVSRTDLADRFGLPRTARAEEGRTVLCGNRDIRHAFEVDEVVGLIEVEAMRIRPLPPQFAGPERAWFTGVFLLQGTLVLVVDPEWLLGFYPRVSEAPPSRPAVPPASVSRSLALAPELTLACHGVQGTMTGPMTSFECVEDGQLEEAGDAEEAPWAEL